MVNLNIDEHKNIIIVHIDGIFDINSIIKVEQKWKEQIEKNPEIIALDCSNLEMVDSSAIGTLVKFLNTAMNKEIKLVFFDLNLGIQRLFETAKLNRFFSITTKNRFENKYLAKV